MKILIPYLLVTVSIFGCNEQSGSTGTSSDVNTVPDFFDAEAGKKPPFEMRQYEKDGSLPYFLFDVPLPENSVLKPFRHYSISIDKDTGKVHSKSISEPLSTLGCGDWARTLIGLLEKQGFIRTTETQPAAPYAEETYVKGSQIAFVSCSSVGGSPFWEIQLKVTTNEEHKKFEMRMRNRANYKRMQSDLQKATPFVDG